MEKVKKPITKKWWFWVIVVFIGIGVIGNLGSNGKDKPANVSVDQQPATEVSKTAEPTKAPEPTKEPEKKEPDIWIKAGMYKVGKDLPAGEYLVASTSSAAYFQVTKDSSGSFDSIIANDNFDTVRYITVKDGQYIDLKNAEIAPIDKAPKLQAVDGKYISGMYKVGRDIEPGEYKVVSDGGSAYLEVVSNSSGGFDAIVANDNFEGEKYISVKKGQYIKLNGCYMQQ